MTKFRGFKTKQEALAYRKENGGLLCYACDEKGRSRDKDYYEMAVYFGGLDAKTYPYCLQWVER